MKNKPTLADVARGAGVSKMTASRALRGAKDVSKKSLKKVKQAALDIGYIGNPLATSLSRQHSDLIGVVVPSMSNIVFAEVLSGIAQAIENTGIQPVFGVTYYNRDKEHEIIRSMLSWRPAGLIVTGVDQPENTRLLLENSGIPIVQIMDLDGDPVDACVGLSQTQAGKDMAEALIRCGRKRFGYVGSALERDTRANKRLGGFKQTLSENSFNLTGMKTSTDLSSVALGRALTDQLLATHSDLDCLYFSNDDMAIGGLFACMSRGIPVPDQILIAGFNGLDLVEALPAQIATSHTPRQEIGIAAANLILTAVREKASKAKKIISFKPVIDLGQKNRNPKRDSDTPLQFQ